MRLKEARIELIAKLIVEQLLQEEIIDCPSKDDLTLEVKRVIIDDLMVEDRLDEEVRNLIRQHQTELDKKRVEYFNMFRLIKDRLIKERNLIL